VAPRPSPAGGVLGEQEGGATASAAAAEEDAWREEEPARKVRRTADAVGRDVVDLEASRHVDLEDMRQHMRASIGSSVAALAARLLPGDAGREGPAGVARAAAAGVAQPGAGPSGSRAEAPAAPRRSSGTEASKADAAPAFHDPHVKECYYHFTTGHCRLGARCPYSHEAVDGQFSGGGAAGTGALGATGLLGLGAARASAAGAGCIWPLPAGAAPLGWGGTGGGIGVALRGYVLCNQLAWAP